MAAGRDQLEQMPADKRAADEAEAAETLRQYTAQEQFIAQVFVRVRVFWHARWCCCCGVHAQEHMSTRIAHTSHIRA